MRLRPRSPRTAAGAVTISLIASGLALAAAFVSGLYLVVTAYSCGGGESTVGRASLCSGIGWAPAFLAAGLSVVAPLVVLGWASAPTTRAVSAAVAGAAGGVSALALITNQAIGGAWNARLFVWLPLAIFVGALLPLRRPIADRGQAAGERPPAPDEPAP